MPSERAGCDRCRLIHMHPDTLRQRLVNLLDAIDRMGAQGPDNSQADYECWEDVWEARKAMTA